MAMLSPWTCPSRLPCQSWAARWPASPASGCSGWARPARRCSPRRIPRTAAPGPPARTAWYSSSGPSPDPHLRWRPPAACSRWRKLCPRCSPCRWRRPRTRVRSRPASPRSGGFPGCVWTAWSWAGGGIPSRRGWNRSGPWRRSRGPGGSGPGWGSCMRGCTGHLLSPEWPRGSSWGLGRARTSHTRCCRLDSLRVNNKRQSGFVWQRTGCCILTINHHLFLHMKRKTKKQKQKQKNVLQGWTRKKLTCDSRTLTGPKHQ